MEERERKVTARQSIQTRYLGPTNYRGTRVVAEQSADWGGKRNRIYVSWDYALGDQENHVRAGMKLARRLGWTEHNVEIYLAGTKEGYALVFTSPMSRVYPEQWQD